VSEQVWFTADLHLGHKRILTLGKGRPFADIQDHDEALIDGWRDRVQPGDRVYFLGDFALCKPPQARAYFDRLPGQKHLIVGNHDNEAIRKLPWASVHELRTVGIRGIWWRDQLVPAQRLTMCHYPLMTWPGSGRGCGQLHGHCHGNLVDTGQPRIDVGVDANGYLPLSIQDVLDRLDGRVYEPVDHHGPEWDEGD
jgi:calcineurin-like phosphoesterase family protein